MLRTRSLTIAAALLFLLAPVPFVQAQPVTRTRLSFNSDWRFQKGDPPGKEGQLSYERVKPWVTATGYELIKDGRNGRPAANLGGEMIYNDPAFDDRGWRQLNLPHDWGIEGPFKQEYPGETGKLPWWGVGWYRKHFNVSPREKGTRFHLDIDGAMAYGLVWLNGQFVGGWPYGYASFELDLTPYLLPGENVIAIRLDNPPDSSRWYPGGGIYRNVWLVKTSRLHVAHWGTYITTPEVNSTSASVELKVTLENSSTINATAVIRSEIFAIDANGQRAARPSAAFAPASIDLAGGGQGTATTRARIDRPKLWSLKNPNQYVAVTTVSQDGRIVDRYETKFGIRTIKFDVARGFLLNGEQVKLQGVCDHHDLGALGSALHRRALERQLEILKEMGVNALRTSHNPPAPELLELADRMGFVVMDEAFDAWRRAKKKNDYHLLFDDWHEKDLRAQVRRDRNHPSVILWSIGNEIGEQGNAEGHALAAELRRIVHE
ncbi:MAG TPA: glycoside hydrolase family 2 TIM barrel-domain containing protein, partial [Pyrinomonadaceae bacterium]|nr:glycoside hydrolase family 2 TIM barrel-domain containing protein [Pyrinomonadaceae bacterium]